MKNIIYKKLSKKFPAKELKDFFDKSLPGKTLEQCQNIISLSSVIIGAFQNNKLVGIARALDDTVYAFFADVLVDPVYRKKGIGSKMVKLLCQELIKRGIRVIHCSTTKDLIPFYKSAKNFNCDSDDITLYLKNLS